MKDTNTILGGSFVVGPRGSPSSALVAVGRRGRVQAAGEASRITSLTDLAHRLRSLSSIVSRRSSSSVLVNPRRLLSVVVVVAKAANEAPRVASLASLVRRAAFQKRSHLVGVIFAESWCGNLHLTEENKPINTQTENPHHGASFQKRKPAPWCGFDSHQVNVT